MKKRAFFLCALFLLAAALSRAAGEAVLAPPASSKPPAASGGSSPGGLSAVFERAAELSAGKDASALRPLLAFLFLVREGTAKALLPEGFDERLEGLAASVRAFDAALERSSLRDALRFRALAARTAFIGFSSDDSLSRAVRSLPGADEIARLAVRFEGLGEGDRTGALRILFLLHPDEAVRLARPWLKSINTALRLAAIRLLGLSGDASLGKRFLKSARDSDLPAELRAEYALAAGRLGAGGADVLAGFVLSPALDGGLRLKCLSALAALGPSKASDTLLRLVLSGGGESLLLTRALDILASWKEERLRPHLSRFLESSRPAMKAAAVRAVRLMRVARLYPAVARLLERENEDSALAVECLRCLGESGVPARMEQVADFLYDKRFEVRLEAAFALQKLSGEDFGLRRSSDTRAQELILRRIRIWWQKRASANP